MQLGYHSGLRNVTLERLKQPVEAMRVIPAGCGARGEDQGVLQTQVWGALKKRSSQRHKNVPL